MESIGSVTSEEKHNNIQSETNNSNRELEDATSRPFEPIAEPATVKLPVTQLNEVCSVSLRFKDIVLDVPCGNTKGIISKLKNSCVHRVVSDNSGNEANSEPKSKKRIMHLDGIEAEVSPGDCVALMGGSGAGKSTFLNILSRRITSHQGAVSYNDGNIPDQDGGFFQSVSAFVQQEDIFFGKLTVEEHLKYQAQLRLDRRTSKRGRRYIVEETMGRMGLTKTRSSRIGNIMEGSVGGISGGEKKRLAVASELLTRPSVIFADEPTTGLDSFMAMSVVDVLKELADHGRTVVCTIHQPSSAVFERFSKLLLLCEGRLIYYGSRRAGIQWFRHLGLVCPAYANPADFFIDCISCKTRDRVSYLDTIAEWARMWKEGGSKFMSSLSRQSSSLHQQIGSVHTTPADSCERQQFGPPQASKVDNESSIHTQKEYSFDAPRQRIGRGAEALVQLSRSFLGVRRNPSLTVVRFVQTLVIGCIPSFMYFRLPYDLKGGYDRVSATFFILLSQVSLHRH
eukprot:GHVQ01012717.1.p1 GENE.GHVQ01012717.1~~GHVQ01012717.1.p1  ORF type:complete len:511 (+),score=48.38 GHVQ01012717.1:423-1955(+)